MVDGPLHVGVQAVCAVDTRTCAPPQHTRTWGQTRARVPTEIPPRCRPGCPGTVAAAGAAALAECLALAARRRCRGRLPVGMRQQAEPSQQDRAARAWAQYQGPIEQSKQYQWWGAPAPPSARKAARRARDPSCVARLARLLCHKGQRVRLVHKAQVGPWVGAPTAVEQRAVKVSHCRGTATRAVGHAVDVGTPVGQEVQDGGCFARKRRLGPPPAVALNTSEVQWRALQPTQPAPNHRTHLGSRHTVRCTACRCDRAPA